MKLCFFDMNPAMCEEWLRAQGTYGDGMADVRIFYGTLDETLATVDPLVISSAGNAFGIMGAGIDGALRRTFPDAQPQVQRRIRQTWRGEMPVGAKSIVVKASKDPLRYLAYTPTMPAPGTKLPNSHGVYMAMRGLLMATEKGEEGRYLAIPGMGTGVGGLGHRDAAFAQMQAVAAMRDMVRDG